ncbi:MAG: aquaporin [Clostridia bacterium]|nr:aquaporin [Clostridia bacterium]
MNDLFKKAIAECIGTFVLVFFAVGTAIISGGNLVATALAFGLALIGMAFSIGKISGCHINPAVSIGCLLTKRMTLKEFGVYVCAQVLGGFLGALILFCLIKLAGMDIDFATAGSNFTPDKTLEVGPIFSALIFEIILTFVFVYVILNVTCKNSKVEKYAGLIIGLTLTLVHLIGINFTGTSVNPARSLATALANAITSGTATALSHVWIFIIAPLLGGALAALVYNLLHKKDDEGALTAE